MAKQHPGFKSMVHSGRKHPGFEKGAKKEVQSSGIKPQGGMPPTQGGPAPMAEPADAQMPMPQQGC